MKRKEEGADSREEGGSLSWVWISILNDRVCVGYWLGWDGETEVSDWFQGEIFPEGGSPWGILKLASPFPTD